MNRNPHLNWKIRSAGTKEKIAIYFQFCMNSFQMLPSQVLLDRHHLSQFELL
jgi:hypothetical protein